MSGSVGDVGDAMDVFAEKFSDVDEAAEQEHQGTGHRVKLVQDAGDPAGRKITAWSGKTFHP